VQLATALSLEPKTGSEVSSPAPRAGQNVQVEQASSRKRCPAWTGAAPFSVIASPLSHDTPSGGCAVLFFPAAVRLVRPLIHPPEPFGSDTCLGQDRNTRRQVQGDADTARDRGAGSRLCLGHACLFLFAALIAWTTFSNSLQFPGLMAGFCVFCT